MTTKVQPTVLVVDDDPGIAELVRSRLEESGYVVCVAHSTGQAFAAVERNPIDLILLDYQLRSGGDGLDFYAQLKAGGHDLPVILVTGYSNESTVIRALRNGVRDFVSKSIEYLDYLPEAVNRVLNQVQTEQQLAASESRLAGVIASAKDAIITTAADGTITLFNPAAERMFRCRASEAMTRTLGRFIPKVCKAVRVRGEGSDGGETASALIRDGRWGLRADGEWFPLEASMSSTTVGGKRVHTVVVRDVTDSRRAQSYIAAQLGVAQAIAVARTIDEGAGQILGAIAQPLGWSVGSLWLADPNNGSPGLLGLWYEGDFQGQSFLDQTRSLGVSEGFGLPGTVWQTGEPQWMKEFAEEPAYCRREAAREAGLRSAYALPLFIQDCVVGVMEFAAARLLEPDSGLLALMNSLGSQIGQFVERKRTEQAVHRTAQELATAQKIARMGSWRLELATNTVTWSDELYRIFGLTPGEPVGPLDRVLGRMPTADRDRVRRGVEESLRTGRTYDCRHGVIHPGGEVRTVHARGDVVRDGSGAVVEMVGTVQDITEAVRAEEQIRDQAALLDKARDAIVVEALDGTIQYWNRGAERLYGWRVQEALGRSMADLLAGDFPARRAEAEQALADRGEWSGEFHQMAKDGRDVVVESSWTLLRDAEGRPKAKLAIQTDVTEKRQLEAQYFRAQRLESLGALAGGIAHDLNNVLTPIQMTLEFLKMPLPDDQRQPVLDMMRASVERGIGLVQQVLSFSRGVEGHRVPVQPRDVIADLESLIRHTFPKNVTLHTVVRGAPWPILGDATQLHQVLMNLCVNARDAMPGGGGLTVGVESLAPDSIPVAHRDQATARGYVRLWVADTGTGITPQQFEKIFNPFFTTKKPGQGTGLGLSTAHGIVKSHGGFFDVATQVGKGTCFSAYLPAVLGDSVETRPAKAVGPLGAGELVLVVDDEASIRQIMVAMLEANGYRVLAAADGTEALALFAENGPAVRAVLTDLLMPVMDGAATIRALRERSRAVPIIAVSGSADESLDRQDDVQAVLQKPFSKTELLEALSRVLHA